MKKLFSIILIAVLAVGVTACSSRAPKEENANSQVSAQSAVESSAAETSKEEEKTVEQVLYDENGIKLTYLGYEEDIFPALKFRIENSSDKSYMVTTDDVSVNDSMISTSIIETVAPGKKSIAKMNMFSSDLEENGIEKIEKVEFKLHCTNSDDFMDSFDSKVLTITNP